MAYALDARAVQQLLSPGIEHKIARRLDALERRLEPVHLSAAADMAPRCVDQLLADDQDREALTILREFGMD